MWFNAVPTNVPNTIFRPDELIDGHSLILDEQIAGHNESAVPIQPRRPRCLAGTTISAFRTLRVQLLCTSGFDQSCFLVVSSFRLIRRTVYGVDRNGSLAGYNVPEFTSPTTAMCNECGMIAREK